MPLIEVRPTDLEHYYPDAPGRALTCGDHYLVTPTAESCGEGLSIIFEHVPHYIAGDIVTGYVELHCPQPRIIGALQLSIICQARTRAKAFLGWIGVSDTGPTPLYGCRCTYHTYMNECQELAMKRHSYESGTYKWPFHVRIPTMYDQPCEPTSEGGKWFAKAGEYSDEPSGPDFASRPFQMPGTFYSQKDKQGLLEHKFAKQAALVEYVVTARAYEFESSQPELPPTICRSVSPIYVRQVPAPHTALFASDRLGNVNQHMHILLRRDGEASLAFKWRKLRFRDSVGKPYQGFSMCYNVSFTFPFTIKLHSFQTSIPLVMTLRPSSLSSAWEDPLFKMPRLQLVWGEIGLRRRDTWKAHGELTTVQWSPSTATLSNPRRQTLELEANWQGEKRDLSWDIDLGRLLNLSVCQSEMWSDGLADQTLPCSFTIEKIQRTYFLDWKICFRTNDDVRVLTKNEWVSGRSAGIGFMPTYTP